MRGCRLQRQTRPLAGQSVVEFALVSLVLLMMIFGTIDLGRGIFQRALLTNADREATRYGMIWPADTNGIRAAARKTSPSLNLPDGSFTVECNLKDTLTNSWSGWASGNCSSSSAKPRDLIKVCVTYSFGLSAPRLIGLDTIAMRECAQASLQ